jgi:hypothetical protein
LATWRAWASVAARLPGPADGGGRSARDQFLGVYGPLAVLLLVALWAALLVLGFALLLWGTGTALIGPDDGEPGFGTVLYFSGVTFFTIGFGDVSPRDGLGKALTVAEGATGLSFLAAIIGYLPVMFTAFADRETEIVLLDARAGSPPAAAELLRRVDRAPEERVLEADLRAWERWAARLLGTHLSYPFLAFFRSQHEQQSWLAMLTVVLDTAALILAGAGGAGEPKRQARLTFAMARHAAGDLSELLDADPDQPARDRLPPAELERLRAALAAAGWALPARAGADLHLTQLRALYEPYLVALADRLQMELPPWVPDPSADDDWATTEWQHDPRRVEATVSATLGEGAER